MGKLAIAIILSVLLADDAHAAEPVDFSRDVLPILSDNCFECHGPDQNAREADLRLDEKESTLRTDEPIVVPGQSGKSELFRRIISTDSDEVMPPADLNRKLTAQQIATLKRWIDEGATWGKHWAFVAPKRPELPTVQQDGWVRNPIDRFVLARLQREKLSPSPTARRETLIRRVTLDLTGMPPTPEEVAAFLADKSPSAYEKVVDRLFQSSGFGERMVWEWLDAARYADTNGYQGDPTRTMYFWRDWVIAALNGNMPFDQFTIEQLAGDLLPKPSQDQLVATGFHRNHMINGEGGRIAEESRVDYVQDRVETTGTVWMGLTFNCCRCHDHKYDPILQKEYYQFSAYFNSVDETGRNDARGLANPIITLSSPEQKQQLQKLRTAEAEANKKRDEVIKQARVRLDDAKKVDADPQVVAAKKEAEAAKKKREGYERSFSRTMVMRDRAKPRETFILVRGAYNKYADKVAHGVPSILPPLPESAAANRQTLAKWLVEPAHPLTARVTVNRYWQMFFGVGLVKTTENFGLQGDLPSHPQLLDWLATEFISPSVAQPSVKNSHADNAWNVKHMLRLIVTSATYRQSSKVKPALLERDPENRLLARGSRFRLPSWMIRDQALAASGLLVERVGGPPVKGYQPAGIWEEATFGKIRYQQDKGEALYRRSLYQFWRRIVGPTIFFDVARRQTCEVKVARTNTPLHALVTLNDVTYVEAARALAQRILLTPNQTDAARIAEAFRRLTAREPNPLELAVFTRRLKTLREHYKNDPDAAKKLIAVGESKADEKLDATELAAFTGITTIILNLDETITKE